MLPFCSEFAETYPNLTLIIAISPLSANTGHSTGHASTVSESISIFTQLLVHKTDGITPVDWAA